MYKTIISLIFVLVLQSNIANGEKNSIWAIVDSLRSNDPNKIEKACRLLGLERGAVGLSKIQFLQPSVRRSLPTNYIITICWEARVDGYLMIVDSRGKVLARKSVGFIKSTCLRSLKEGGDDVLVIDAIRGTGTGVREDRFSIVAVSNKGLDVLWEGLSYRQTFLRQLAPDKNHETKCSITFEDIDGDGIDEIIYEIKRIKYSYNSETHRLLPEGEEKTTEVYKLIGGKYEFLKETK